jgi:methylmalonyl-CoA mutase
MQAKLFSEFPPLKKSDWLAELARDLKGKSFEETLVWKTIEGIDVQPVYTAEDVSPIAIPAKPSGEWLLREEIFERDFKKANEQARFALNRGASAVAFFAEPTAPSEINALFDGIWLEAAPVHFYVCRNALSVLNLFLDEVRSRKLDSKFIHGTVDVDAIAAFASEGKWDKDAFSKAREMIALAKAYPNFKTMTIRADVYHNAGATLAQELAFALATTVEYLAALTEQGVSADEILAHIEISFAISSNYFLEIAKLRAARWLFKELAGIYGANAAPTIHASSATWNKTIFDSHNNLLRATVEAMAAATGGADSITVARFDDRYAKPNEFSAHLSRNTSLILKDESHLDKTIDASKGSYYLESLTETLGEKAWKYFQQIESSGGMIAALRSGAAQSDIRRAREAKEKLIAEKKEQFIGVTKSPNAKEKMRDKIEATLDLAAPPSDAEIETIRPFRAVAGLEQERLKTE